MDYETLKRSLSGFYGKDLNHRKHWYSPAAIAYDKARPRYPQVLIDRVIQLTQLNSNSRILEIGCGPGTATSSIAPLGCPIVCLEPNPDFYQLACQNCAPFPNVQICNTAFEEWALEAEQFDAVLAASSLHWIPPDVAYPKAAAALRATGYLILLWNKELQPASGVYQRLSEVYQQYAPMLDRYEDRATQAAILQGLGQMAIDSGYFQDLGAGQNEVYSTYSAADYLTLLNTYSPYLNLELEPKTNLFAGLGQAIEQYLNGYIELSYLSAFHIYQPFPRVEKSTATP